MVPGSAFEGLSGSDLDSEPGKAHVGEGTRGQQADRRDADVAQNLRSKPDLAPLAVSNGFRARLARLQHGYAGCTITQQNQHPATFSLEACERTVKRFRLADQVPHDVRAMQSHRNVVSIAD